MTPTLADSILTGFRSTSMREPEVAGEGSLVCIYKTSLNSSSDFLFLWKTQNVMQGAHIYMRDSTLYVAQNVCPVIIALMVSDMDLTFYQD